MKCAPHKQSPVFSIKARTCGSIATNTPRPGNRLGDEIYNNNKTCCIFQLSKVSLRAAKSPSSWTLDSLWVSVRYLLTSNRGLKHLLVLSTSRCHSPLHLCSPSREPGSGVSSAPPLLPFLSSSSCSPSSSEETNSLSDATSFSKAKENIWAASCPLVPLTGWTEQDSGRISSRESRSCSVCNWL